MVSTLEKYEFHEYCLLFPQADERTLSDMADDIAKNGLKEAITLYEDKILDGRNRYLACQMANVTPTYNEYQGDDPLQYVISKNLHRRHMNEAQRADMAARALKLAKERKTPVLLGEVAKQFNVGQTTIQKAEKIRDDASEKVKQAVADGTIAINRAVGTLKTAQEQTGIKISKHTSDADKQKVHEAQDRLVDALPERGKKENKGILTEQESAPKPNKSTTAKEFNDKVLSGVFDGTRFRKDIGKIQEIITKMEEIPELYNDAYEMIQTTEQMKSFKMAVGLLVDTIKKAETTLRSDDTDFKKVQQALKALQADKFKIEPHEETDRRELLESVMQKFFDEADDYVKQAKAVLADLQKREASIT